MSLKLDEVHGSSWRRLLRRLHHDQRGGVSIETILIIAAIALPILIFIIKFAWPKIRDEFFWEYYNELQGGSGNAGGAGP